MISFLVDANLPKATGPLILSHGHQACDVRDVGLGAAEDLVIAAYAQSNRLCIITRDSGFGNVLDYPPQDYPGIDVVQAPMPPSAPSS